MTQRLHSSGIPISAKGVVVDRGRVLLLLNERNQWDLPGGRPEPHEELARTVEREVREESGAEVAAVAEIDQWRFEVLPGRFVWIVAWGCRALSLANLRVSHEHRRLQWFAADALARIDLPEGYGNAARLWLARSA